MERLVDEGWVAGEMEVLLEAGGCAMNEAVEMSTSQEYNTS